MFTAFLLALALWTQEPAKPTIRVHGTLPQGARLEFRLVGQPERFPAEGKYSLSLTPGRYDLVLTYGSGRRILGSVSLSNPEVELNAHPENPKPSSGVEYDLFADWRVVAQSGDDSGKGVGPASVILEVEPARGAPQKLNAWVITDDGEKEISGSMDTNPDGRFVFRARESRLRPEDVIALRVTVSRPGFQPATMRIVPVLEFSEAGHFYARYPDEGVEIKLKKVASR